MELAELKGVSKRMRKPRVLTVKHDFKSRWGYFTVCGRGVCGLEWLEAVAAVEELRMRAALAF
jgi:hypothetical protein